jgi:purine-binding chemotaxis protein CheW
MSTVTRSDRRSGVGRPVATDSTRLLTTFVVDGIRLGVDALEVQEVLRFQAMTLVPLAPGEVRGLINLRGQVVTAIDLRRRLRRPDREPGVLPMNVVVRTDDGPVSLLVDEIGDVIDVPVDSLEENPETVSDLERELVLGVHKLDGQLLMVLDVSKVSTPMDRTP